MRNKKKSKTQSVIENTVDIVSKVFRVLTKIYGMIFVLILLGFGVFMLFHGFIAEGSCMLLGAIFLFVCYK